ncbi:hypothetical protein SAMN06264941_0684 [Methanohalophilus portucalensis FDF-1]|jgi:hypothetical protein|uniref:Uncharacterized protein n=2 Tax=Methanohalophilus portucalensis FDF-1 TaxID=523843 RepID=A0A1X7N9J2_9EURY|nr:hypothetical protein SAMN06264941_0684 [Methanohalophilus portucalensis FDF-1]
MHKKGSVKMKVQLNVDGENIEINDFVQKFLGKTAAASAESLHGVDPTWKEIDIHIKK